jgi:hypothetical protein
VIFKGPCGPLIKDLDEEILAKEDEPDGPRKEASQIIKNLRKEITTLNGLLTVLGPRYTSWSKDRTIISGLLVDIDLSNNSKKDIWQQDIYKSILRKIGMISPGHLFRNAATMYKGFSWCPTSLFSMPRDSSNDSLTIDKNGNVKGNWRLIRVDDALEKNCFWNGIHPLIKEQLQDALKYPRRCVLLASSDAKSMDRALLVKVIGKREIPTTICCQYVGTVWFLQELTRREDADDWIPMDVTLLGHTDNTQATAVGNAWKLVKKLRKETSIEQSHYADGEKTRGGESEAHPNTQAIKGEEDPIHGEG